MLLAFENCCTNWHLRIAAQMWENLLQRQHSRSFLETFPDAAILPWSNGTGGHTVSLGTSPIFATLPAPRKPVTLLTPRDQLGLSPDPWMTVPWINHWMPDYVFASFPLLASYSLCLAVGLGHSQSLPSHMVLGGQCQSLSNSQTLVMAAQREAFLSTLSSIANIWHNSLAQHFFVINQSINFTLLRFEAHMVYSALL